LVWGVCEGEKAGGGSKVIFGGRLKRWKTRRREKLTAEKRDQEKKGVYSRMGGRRDSVGVQEKRELSHIL